MAVLLWRRQSEIRARREGHAHGDLWKNQQRPRYELRFIEKAIEKYDHILAR